MKYQKRSDSFAGTSLLLEILVGSAHGSYTEIICGNVCHHTSVSDGDWRPPRPLLTVWITSTWWRRATLPAARGQACQINGHGPDTRAASHPAGLPYTALRSSQRPYIIGCWAVTRTASVSPTGQLPYLQPDSCHICSLTAAYLAPDICRISCRTAVLSATEQLSSAAGQTP